MTSPFTDSEWRSVYDRSYGTQSGVSRDELRETYRRIHGTDLTDNEDSERSGLSNFTRGAALGGAESITSLGEVAGLIPGLGGVGRGSAAARQRLEEGLDPEGFAGSAGRFVGRAAGEIGQAMLGAPLIVKGLGVVAPRVAKALQAGMASGSRLTRAGAVAAANAPIDVLQGAKYEEGVLLPGRLGSIAENIGFSGAAGALLPAARGAREAIPEQRRLGPGQYEMGPVTTRLEPETNPARLLGSRSQGVVPEQVDLTGPAVPVRGEVGADEIARRLEEAASGAPGPVEGIEVVPGLRGRTRQRQAKNMRSVRESAGELAADLRARRALPTEDVDASRALEVAAANRQRPSGLILRPGTVNPQLLAQGGGAALGGAVGALTTPEDEGALGRAGRIAAGAAVGAGMGRIGTRARGAKPLDRAIQRQRAAEEAAIARQRGADADWLEPAMARQRASDEAFERAAFRNRSGVVDPQLLAQGGGAALGGAVGGLTSPEGEDAFGVAGRVAGGAALGAGLGRIATRPRGAKSLSGVSSPAAERIRATINTGTRATSANPAWLTPTERFFTDIFSETFPLVKAAEEAAGATGKSRMQGAIAQMHGHQRAAQLYLEETIGPALQGSKDVADDVRVLLKASRDLDIRRRGGAAKSAVSEQDLADAGAALMQNPQVVKAADAINEMHRDLLTKRWEAGLLTDDAYKAILDSEDFYTPFVREFAEEAMARGSKGGRLAVATPGVNRMDRTMESIANTADPLEVAVAAAQRTYRDIAKQRIQNIVTEFADAGKLPFIERVAANTTLPPNAMTYTQIVNGKPVKYRVTDKEVYDLLTGVDDQTTNVVMQMAQAFTRFGRTAITMMPDFAVANLIRDLGQSAPQRLDVGAMAKQSGMGAAFGGLAGLAAADEDESLASAFIKGAGFGAGAGAFAKPLGRTLRAVGEVAGNGEAYREYIRAGGSTEGFNVRTPKDAREALKALQRSGVSLSDVVNPVRWVDALQWIGSVGEQASRLAAFKQARGEGMDAARAAFHAQDVSLRFRNVGRSTKDIASVTKFWNAKVQGWDKLRRMIKDPKTAGMAATMITAPSVALWYTNKDNPEYWNRPGWERNLFWLVPKDGGKEFWRIPKPFEFGYIFASLPERVLDYMAQKGMIASAAGDIAEPGAALAGAARDMAFSTMEGSIPIPDVLSTGIQMRTGRDWFRNRNIVSRPNLPTGMQVGDRTSALARQAGKLGVSPEMVDFGIQEVAGSAGRFGSQVADALARQAGMDAPSTAMDPKHNLAIPSRFQTRQYQMTDRESSARDRMRALDRTWAGFQQELKSGDEQAIAAYERKHRRDLESRSALNDARVALDRISDRRRGVLRNPTIPDERKREIIGEMREAADDVARVIQSYRAGRQP